MTYFSRMSPREPYCIHSGDVKQPASACIICKEGQELADWIAFWETHQHLIPSLYRRNGDRHD
jgi:hypothetical protein